MTETIFEDVQNQIKKVRTEMDILENMFKIIKKEHIKPIEKQLNKKEKPQNPKFTIKKKTPKDFATLIEVQTNMNYVLLTKAIISYMRKNGEDNILLKKQLSLGEDDKLTYFNVQRHLSKIIN